MMSAYIKQLLDKEENDLYPVTKASAVYMERSERSVQDVVDDMQDGDTEIKFLVDGSIEKELASGNKVTTVFGDSRITETTTNTNEDVVMVKTTTFNSDGSISITITRGGN